MVEGGDALEEPEAADTGDLRQVWGAGTPGRAALPGSGPPGALGRCGAVCHPTPDTLCTRDTGWRRDVREVTKPGQGDGSHLSSSTTAKEMTAVWFPIYLVAGFCSFECFHFGSTTVCIMFVSPSSLAHAHTCFTQLESQCGRRSWFRGTFRLGRAPAVSEAVSPRPGLALEIAFSRRQLPGPMSCLRPRRLAGDVGSCDAQRRLPCSMGATLKGPAETVVTKPHGSPTSQGEAVW